MREKLLRFMQGRYGIDAFGKFTVYLGLILALADLLFRNVILSVIALLIWGYSYFRMFSRNIYKRIEENNKYLNCKAAVTGFFRKIGSKLGIKGPCNNGYRSKCGEFSGNRVDKQYKVFKCPECGQKLRVPRGRGKILITCCRCKKEFKKRT